MSISNTKTSKRRIRTYIQIKNSIMNNEFTSDTSLTEAFYASASALAELRSGKLCSVLPAKDSFPFILTRAFSLPS